MAPVLGGKSIGLDQKAVLKAELLIWRTKNQARDQGRIQQKDSILLKSIQTSGTRDLRTPKATAFQPPRTLCFVAIIENFPKITLLGPTVRHLYSHR